MADKKYGPPGVDLLQEGAVDMDSYRARRINSLHRSVDELVQEQNKKRLQISNEVNGLTKEQQKMMAQLEFERGEMSNDVAQGYSNVLKGLGRTINSLASGVKNITVDTGKATTQAIGQYGKAISEDININKTNTIAMALSRATPLFGYFAAKFMETDVFQDAASRIKGKIGDAMSQGLSKAGESVSNIFRKGKEVIAEEKERQPATVADLEALKNDMDLPHLQEGGYVREGGIVEVHAAEVVTPIDKLLKQLDESKNADIARRLNATMTLMSERMNQMETVVVDREQSQKGFIQTFIQEFNSARDTKAESYQRRLLKAVLELKVGLIGMTSRIRIAWQRTLLQHPAFRNMLLFADVMKGAILSPIQFLFGARGGYAGKARRAQQTHNVFQKSSNLLSLIYTSMMPKLDELVAYTKATAEAITGGPVSVTGTAKTYTMFGKIRETLTSRSLGSSYDNLFQTMIERLGLDKEAMGEAGVTSFGSLLRPGRIGRRMGISKENIMGQFTEEAPGKGFFESLKSDISKLRKMKEDQEEREGPHSPSMAENIASTAHATESTAEETRGFKKTVKGWGSRIWDLMLFAGAFLKDMFFKGIGTLKSLITPILSFFTAGAGTAVAGGIGTGGIGAALGAGVAKVGSIASTAAVGLTGVAVGGGMGIWDMISAIREGNATGFVGNWLIRGVAGFLGGTDTGWAGAKRGALKGGALGAGIGTFFGGPIGTAIGGAIGAAAGGMLGFLGGKDISKGISETLSAIGDWASGMWKIVTFPMKVFRESFKATWVIVKWGFNKVFGPAIDAFKEWWNSPGIVSDFLHSIIDFFKKIIDAIKKPFIWIGEKIKAFFSAGFWETIKKGMYHMLFPFATLSKVFKYVRDKVDDKIESLPVIGSIYKKVKTAISEVNEGTFASNLEKSLSEESNYKNKSTPTKTYQQLPPAFKFMREQRIKDKERMEAYKKRIASDISERSPMMDRLIKSSNYTETKTLEMSNKRIERLEKGLGKNIKDGAKQTVQAYVQATNISSSNNNSVNNSSGGGGGSGYSFTSADKFASDVTRCNIN